jgi:hypothetical protein
MDFTCRENDPAEVPFTPEAHDFDEMVPPYLTRLDMPDARTRLHVLRRGVPGDIQGYNDYEVHRVMDRVARTTLLDLWKLDCESGAEWRDNTLDLLVQPGDLRLRIDAARGEGRIGGDDAPWLPLDELQARVDLEIGTGFGYRLAEERWQAEYEAAAPDRAEAQRRERRKQNLECILAILFFLGLFLLWYLDPTGAFEKS